jgi:alpha,alpha-trehalase
MTAVESGSGPATLWRTPLRDKLDKRLPRSSTRNPFPPIADYAFLSDCENTCLISSGGSVEWLCVPRPDSPSVFGAILDRAAGHFRLGPYGVSVPAARRYLPGSQILETTWQTHTGWLIVRDTLVLGPWHDIETRSHTHRRTPMDWDAEHILLRTVRCVSGTVDLVMNCQPAFDYHRISASWEYSAADYGEAIAKPNRDPDAHPKLKLTTNLRIGLEGREPRARTRLTKGDNVFVALSWGKHPAPQTFDEAADKMWQTSEAWRQWINIGDFPDHPWRSFLQRSALTLKGLTYSPTGALLAAPTTSLPETPQGERNWDYRYSWVRDSTFALWGLYTLGLDREADDFFSFIADVSGANTGERHPLQVMYAVGGERTLVEDELSHLSGYDNARPVRIGNSAYNQSQHDIWGTMLDSVYLQAKSREHIPETLWPVLITPGRGGHQALARTRPRHLGGARRAPALHLVKGDVLGGPGPRVETSRAAGREELRPAMARDRRGDQGRHPRPRRRLPRGAHPALRRRRAGRLTAARGADPLPARRRPTAARDGARHRRRAHRRRPGPALPDRRNRRRPDP